MAEIIVPEILRTEENGIEYFTVAVTGESAVSERGLAKMCGVNINAVQYILKALDQQKPIKMLESLIGQEFYLTNKVVKRGKDIKPIKANVAAKIIRYYDRKGKPEAQASFDAIAEIGLTHFIQVKTGWVSGQYKAAPQAQAKIDRILNSPDPWRKLYEKEFCDRAFKWFGGRFYWDFCYCWMTPEEKAKHERLNPILRNLNGQTGRKYKIHQLIDSETRDRLTPRIRELAVLIGSNPTKERFLNGYCNLYGQGWQLELFREDTSSALIV